MKEWIFMVMRTSLAMSGVVSMHSGDFAGGVCVGDGLSSALCARRVISATVVRPELLTAFD